MSADLVRRFICLPIAIALPLQAARAQDLAEVLPRAMASNPAIAAERERLVAARRGVGKALAGAEPTISVEGSLTAGKDRVTGGTPTEDSLLSSSVPRSSYDVTIDQPLFESGRTLFELRKAIATVRAQAAKLDSVEQDTLLQAATDYFDVGRDQADCLEADELVAVSQRTLEGEQAKVRNGEGSRLDLAAAQAALASATADRLSAGARLVESKENFLRDVGVDSVSPILDLPKILLPAVGDGVDLAVEKNPDVVGAGFLLEASKQDVLISQAQGRPSVNLEGALRERDGAVFPAERESQRSLSVQLKMPLFSGGAVRADVGAKRAEAQASTYELDKARAQAAAQLRTASEQYSLLSQSESSYTDAVTSDETILQGTTRSYELGAKDLEDVLQAQKSLATARRTLLSTKHDRIVALLKILRATGALTLDRLGFGARDPDLDVYVPKLIKQNISVPFIR